MRIISVISAMLLIGSAHDAHAYLDPGTGSVFLQMLIAGIVSAIVAIKMCWRRVVDMWFRLFKRKK